MKAHGKNCPAYRSGRPADEFAEGLPWLMTTAKLDELHASREADGWKPNPGVQPEETIGKRVEVELANGSRPPSNEAPYPPGWEAGSGKPGGGRHKGCIWRKIGSPFDIAFYRVL